MSELIHFRPDPKNGNVGCLNGNAHARDTFDINLVTCPKCLDRDDNKYWWKEKGIEYPQTKFRKLRTAFNSCVAIFEK